VLFNPVKPMTDDANLLLDYVDDGSEAAFSEMVRRHFDLVYGAAMRRVGGDAHAAADVAQDVFVALARDARKLSRHPHLGAWLHTSTRNAALNRLIADQRRKRREAEAMTMEPKGRSDEPEWDRLRPLLDDAIDDLPELDRVSIIQRFLERRSFAEIGAELRISGNAARMRTERALGKLQRALARRGIASTAAAIGAIVTKQTLASAPAGLSSAVAVHALKAASAPSVPGVLALSMISKLFTAAAVVAAGGILVAVYFGHSRPLRTEEVEPPQSRLLEAEQKQIASPKQFATSGQPNSKRSSLSPAVNQLDYVLDHPELRAAYARLLAYQLAPFWGGQGSPPLNLSTGQKEALTRMMKDYGYALLDTRELARANRMTDSEVYSSIAQVTQTYINNGKQILGDSTYQQLLLTGWHPINYNTPALNAADLLATSTDPTEPPMTVQQEAQLTRILVKNQFTSGRSAPSDANRMAGISISDDDFNLMQPSANPVLPAYILPLSIITDAAISQAMALLPPAQVQALRDLQSLQLAQIGVSAGQVKPNK
jgi:RNA polymerase sigma factor (sigma-70 family)